MPDEDRTRIQHMIEACEDALQFSAGHGREAFDEDKLLLFAVVRAVEIVGEAASQVSRETRDRSPQVPWAEILGMRNRLIHAYFKINTAIVWETVREDIPALLPQLRALIDP